MGDLDDLFGPTPMGPRPTHPDFQKLVHLVLAHDGKTEDPGYDMEADLAAICDPKSISYMALQRGFRMAGLMGIDPIARPEVAVKLASLWIDAWMLGSQWAKLEPVSNYHCSVCGKNDDEHAFAACAGGEWRRNEAK